MSATAAETARLQALEALQVLDLPPSATFDQVVQVASLMCGTPIALVSLVDSDRLCFVGRTGLDVHQVPSKHSLCDYAILTPQTLLEVRDASCDARFADSPLVTGPPGIRFYAGAPLVTSQGHAIGTLCVIDRKARDLSESQRVALESLAQLVMQLMESRQRELHLQQALAARGVH